MSTRTQVSITLIQPQASALAVANDLQQIAANCSPDEVALLRKVCQNPFAKNMALQALRNNKSLLNL